MIVFPFWRLSSLKISQIKPGCWSLLNECSSHLQRKRQTENTRTWTLIAFLRLLFWMHHHLLTTLVMWKWIIVHYQAVKQAPCPVFTTAHFLHTMFKFKSFIEYMHLLWCLLTEKNNKQLGLVDCNYLKKIVETCMWI